MASLGLTPRRAAPDLAALAALALLSGLYFLPWLSHGWVLGFADYPPLNGPLYAWLHHSYAAGQDAQWWQAVGCGEPAADAQLTPQNYLPTRLLLTLWPGATAYTLHLSVHVAWLAGGAYLLARQLGGSRAGAWLGALCAGFAGGPAFSFIWFSVLVSLAWTPWMLLGLLRLQAGGGRARLGGAALLGLSLGFGFNGGYPGMVLYAAVVLALLHAQWLLRAAPRQRRRVWGALGLAALIAALLSAGALLGLRRLGPQSLRGAALSAQAAAETSLSPAALAEAVAPHALGRGADGSFLGASWRFGSFEPQGLVLYVGLLGLLLALAGWRERRDVQGTLWLAWALFVLYALGPWTPLHAWASGLPGLDHLRAPLKAGLFTGVLLCASVAAGYERLRRQPGAWPSWLLAGLGLLLLAAALGLRLGEEPLLTVGRARIEALVHNSPFHHRPPEVYLAKLARWLHGARLHLAWQGLLALAGAAALAWLRRAPRAALTALSVLLLLDLWGNSLAGLSLVPAGQLQGPSATLDWLAQRRAQDPEPWRIAVWGRQEQRLRYGGGAEPDPVQAAALLELPDGNQASEHGLEQFNGYSVAALRRSQDLYGWAGDDRPDADLDKLSAEFLRRRRLLDLGAVRYLVSSRPLAAPGLRPVFQGRAWILENERALPYACLAGQVEAVSNAAQALAALGDPADPRARWPRPALVEAPAGAVLGSAPGTARFLRRDDQAWELAVDVQGGPGTLLLSRLYYAGLFQATVDAAPAPLWPANGAFCAVPVPAGTHRVRIELRPQRLGPALAGAGLALACLLVLLALMTAPEAP